MFISNSLPTKTSTFDPSDRNYLCCCGLLHVVTGARIFHGLLWLFTFFAIFEVFFTFPALAICLCTYRALQRESPELLYPVILLKHITLVCQALIAVLIPISGLFSFFVEAYASGSAVAHWKSAMLDHDHVLLAHILAEIVLILCAAWTFWGLHVFRRCRDFYEDKRAHVLFHAAGSSAAAPALPTGIQDGFVPSSLRPAQIMYPSIQ